MNKKHQIVGFKIQFITSHKSLENILVIAATIRPDKIIISHTIDEKGKLEKAAEYLKHKIKKWFRPIEVIAYKTWEPIYFEPLKESYFPLLKQTIDT
ncbi:hypothetical protein [Mucilaginibacter sp. 10I4]|uniref:hypothetical protein n=1 Tax=Mucilaginibacter sp. 10I4 TaxID=3048580 RepID=UPI002B22DA2E|nr:hypothetical protein [Mucilaginibacter sp. 10I4]MEB0262045.1 hypothetical protein [Mucilaginibacter sp. 10I4]